MAQSEYHKRIYGDVNQDPSTQLAAPQGDTKSIRVSIKGVGVVRLDSSFLTLPKEEQERIIEEIHQTHSGGSQQPAEKGPHPETQDSDWVGQTVGGAGGAAAGAVAGAYAGSALAPFTFGLSIPIGAILGGAIGGALGGAAGEAAEQSIDNFLDDDIETKWNELSPQQQEEIIAAGVEEGVFGMIPGGLGGAAKGARLIAKAGRKKSIDWVTDKVKAVFRNTVFRATTGKTGSVGLGQVAADTAGKGFDAVLDVIAPGKLASWAVKLSPKQKEKIIRPLIEDFVEETRQYAKKHGGRDFNAQQMKDDLMTFGFGQSEESLIRLFERVQGSAAGQIAIKKWAQNDIVRKALIGAGLIGAKGVGKAVTEFDYGSEWDTAAAYGGEIMPKGYAKGGLLTGNEQMSVSRGSRDYFVRALNDFVDIYGRAPYSEGELDDFISDRALRGRVRSGVGSSGFGLLGGGGWNYK